MGWRSSAVKWGEVARARYCSEPRERSDLGEEPPFCPPKPSGTQLVRTLSASPVSPAAAQRPVCTLGAGSRRRVRRRAAVPVIASDCRLGAVLPQDGHLEARHRASSGARLLHSVPLRTGGAFATTSGGTVPAFSAAADANRCAWRADRLDFHGFLSRFEPFRSASPATPARLPLAY